MKKLKLWNRKRMFLKAYRILRNEAERHSAADHDMIFRPINEAHFSVDCIDCPNLYP